MTGFLFYYVYNTEGATESHNEACVKFLIRVSLPHVFLCPLCLCPYIPCVWIVCHIGGTHLWHA